MTAGIWDRWPHHTHGQEAERDKHWCPITLLPFIQTDTPDQGKVLTIRVSLLFSFNVPWKDPHRHALKLISNINLKSVTLIMNTDQCSNPTYFWVV